MGKHDGNDLVLIMQAVLAAQQAVCFFWLWYSRIGSAGQRRRVFYDKKAEADAALVRELKRRCIRQYVECGDL